MNVFSILSTIAKTVKNLHSLLVISTKFIYNRLQVFMARKQSSMDGFVSRRPSRMVGGAIGGDKTPPILKSRNMQTAGKTPPRPTRSGVTRAEIDSSLRSIDDEEKDVPVERRHRKQAPPKSSTKAGLKKWIKRFFIFVSVVVVLIGGYLGIRAIIASANVLQGNFFDLLQSKPLAEDQNGRSNILILGTSEDDPGHEGANLTDSMMVMSINQKQKNAFMFSIPRDLYVKYGEACNSGYAGKINEYYSCVHDGEGVEADRKALKKEAEFIGNILDMDIQYGVNVNYTVVREMIKAVGGTITVNIEGNGAVPAGIKPGSVMDSNFDWKCGPRYQRTTACPPRGHYIDLEPGLQELDAERALYLAQARGDSSPTWGLAQSNFDREKNQQKIIKSLRSKAMSVGVLADFGKVSQLIDALGNNLRTTFATKEFRTLVSLAREIDNDHIKSISLVDKDEPVVGTDMVGAMSVVVPLAGTYDYSGIQAYIHKKIAAEPFMEEKAPVLVLNGSGVSGVAQDVATKLEDSGFVVAGFDNAPESQYPDYVIYRIGGNSPATAKKLESRFGVKITSKKLPAGITIDDTVQFVVIVGKQPDIE